MHATSRILGLFGFLFAGHALACASHSASTARTTSAQHYASGSPELRTVDNTGYVDPGGRTGQVSAGTATTSGRGTAVAPARREYPTGSATTTTTATAGGDTSTPGVTTPADPSEVTSRAARALCDREAFCDHVGAGKTFESADACMTEKRERVHRAIDDANCSQIRSDRIAQCLNAIRAEECGATAAPLKPPRACTADVMCK